MKIISQYFCLLLLISLTTGCASAYWVDRGNDAMDIFTASLSVGAGVKVRTGPVHVGIIADMNSVGLRGGEIQGGRRGLENGDYELLCVPVIDRGGGDKKEGIIFSCESFEGNAVYDNGGRGDRGKDYYAFGSIPFVTTSFKRRYVNPAYFSDMQVAAGVPFVFRVGFNPGELLDFILGWTSLDIYGDDIETLKENGLYGPPSELVQGDVNRKGRISITTLGKDVVAYAYQKKNMTISTVWTKGESKTIDFPVKPNVHVKVYDNDSSYWIKIQVTDGTFKLPVDHNTRYIMESP